MNLPTPLPETKIPIRLKNGETFFAAGESFNRASSILSDGAFKLFVHLCLRADRRTGRYETTMKQLATALHKSRRIIGSYAAEVRAKEICTIQMGSNQYERTVIEICDDYWPYVRESSTLPGYDHKIDLLSVNVNGYLCEKVLDTDREEYLKRIRDTFVSLGCVRGGFRTADGIVAESFFNRGIPLAVVCDALAVGAVRKYCSWLNGGTNERIASLKYFEAVVDELLHNPLPPGYSAYIVEKLGQLRRLWINRQNQISTSK